MPNSTRCRLDGAQSISAPNAAIWVAASTLKIAAVIDAWGVASNGRTTTYISAVDRRGDEEDVGADLDAVAGVEVVAELGPREQHQRHEERRERQIDDPRLVGAAVVHVGEQEHHVDRADHEQRVREVHRAAPGGALADRAQDDAPREQAGAGDHHGGAPGPVHATRSGTPGR